MIYWEAQNWCLAIVVCPFWHKTVLTNELYGLTCKRDHGCSIIMPTWPTATSGHVVTDRSWWMMHSWCICLHYLRFFLVIIVKHTETSQWLKDFFFVLFCFFLTTCQQLELSVIWMFCAFDGWTRLYLVTAQCLAVQPLSFLNT